MTAKKISPPRASHYANRAGSVSRLTKSRRAYASQYWELIVSAPDFGLNPDQAATIRRQCEEEFRYQVWNAWRADLRRQLKAKNGREK